MKQKLILVEVKKENLLTEYNELKKKATLLKSKYTWEMFKILDKALKIGKKMYGKYSFGIPSLSKDFDLSISTINRILSLKRANKRTLKLIYEGKIASHSVALILRRKSLHYQNEIVDLVMKNNLTTADIMKLRVNSLKDINKERKRIAINKGYAQRTNAYRGFKTSFEKMMMSLEIDIEDFPKCKYEEIIKMVNLLKNKCEKYNVL